MPPLRSAPLFKRWERGDEVSHSLKIACKTSRSVGPCADSSAPVPGSLCEKPPPSPPGRGERDGAGWQCLGAALPEHDVAPGGNASPRSSAFIPAPAARNRIWEGLSEAPWLREAKSCSFGPSCASDSPHLALGVPSVCAQLAPRPRVVPVPRVGAAAGRGGSVGERRHSRAWRVPSSAPSHAGLRAVSSRAAGSTGSPSPFFWLPKGTRTRSAQLHP